MQNLSQQAQIDRKLSQRSLYYLCKEVLGYRDVVPHVHGDLAHFFTDAQYGRFRQGTMPRSWFKTWFITVAGSIWLTLPDEEQLYTDIFPYKGANCRILIASNVIDNAAKMVHKIKQEWMNNARLREAFPELVPDFNKTRWSDHAAEIERTLNATEASYTAVGVGGSVISQHFDHIIEDDLIYAKKDDFTGSELMPSQEDIDNAIGWHKLSYSLLANPATGGMWNVGTRWAPQDLVNYIRKHEHQYKCFEISATRDAAWPISSDADCIWPERYGKAVMEQIFMSQGARIAETQYLNRPRSMDDVVFDATKIVQHASRDEFPSNMTYYTAVDLAGWGDSKGTARNAVVTAARDDKNHVWVARVDVGRFNPTQVIDMYKDHSRQFGSIIYVEEIQYQAAVSFWSREEMERTGEMFTQRRLPRKSYKDAKKLRIVALEPLISNGTLHILSSMKTLLEEVELYPYSKTVDILDCLGYLKEILPISRPDAVKLPYEQFKMENIEREIKNKRNGALGLPFDVQLRDRRGLIYGRN